MNPEAIFSLQWPNKIHRLITAKGYHPVGANYDRAAKKIEMQYSEGLTIIIRPRHVEVNHSLVEDRHLEAFLRDLPEASEESHPQDEQMELLSQDTKPRRSCDSRSPRKASHKRADKYENINGWSIRKDRHGYFRAYRRIGGKVKSVYLGKDLQGADGRLLRAEG